MRIYPFFYEGNPKAEKLLRELRDLSGKFGIDLVEDSQQAEIAIALGGDGTMIHCLREMSLREIPTLGFNAGDVGFLTVDGPMAVILEKIKEGQYQVLKRLSLSAECHGKTYGQIINDVVLENSRASARFMIQEDGNNVYSDMRANGLVISTPTGSTAYNSSNGGSIAAPGVEVFLFTAIAPMQLNVAPMIFAPGSIIKIRVVAAKDEQFIDFLVDGKTKCMLSPGDEIIVRRDEKPHLMIDFGNGTFYRALKEKKNLLA